MTAEYERETVEELQYFLIRNGFVRCDIPACNCGSWHARYGLKERVDEITAAVADAGYPLCNENGHLLRVAINDLINELNELRKGQP